MEIGEIEEQLTKAKARVYDCIAMRDMWSREFDKADKEVGGIMQSLERAKLDAQQEAEQSDKQKLPGQYPLKQTKKTN